MNTCTLSKTSLATCEHRGEDTLKWENPPCNARSRFGEFCDYSQEEYIDEPEYKEPAK
jgi:hypothetical protein